MLVECLVKISNFSLLFSYVRNTYPNEKKEGGDFWHELEKGWEWELVLQREERRRGCLTGSTRKVYQFLPRKLVGKSISSFSKCAKKIFVTLRTTTSSPHHPINSSHLSPSSSITPTIPIALHVLITLELIIPLRSSLTLHCH